MNENKLKTSLQGYYMCLHRFLSLYAFQSKSDFCVDLFLGNDIPTFCKGWRLVGFFACKRSVGWGLEG